MLSPPVPLPATLRFGRFRLKATRAPHGEEPVDAGRTMILTPPLGTSTAVPDDWRDASAAPPGNANGSLLEAFCEGAGLDASMLSSEEPDEIMRRAGAVFRQMVLGVGDLMAERDRAHALLHAALQHGPVVGGDDAGHAVERQDAVNRVGVRVHREGDAQVEQVPLRRAGAGGHGRVAGALELTGLPSCLPSRRTE